MNMASTVVAILVTALTFGAVGGFCDERTVLTPEMSEDKIAQFHPKDVNPSLLPLDSIEELGKTGTPQQVNIDSWQLEVRGSKVENPLSITYEQLAHMKMTKKKVILICQGLFVDYAEWEGVPVSVLLEKAKVRSDYSTITFYGLDGYSSRFSRDETENHLLFLALKVNGATLPEEHGFPARLVAEDILGDRWVKWLSGIDVE